MSAFTSPVPPSGSNQPHAPRGGAIGRPGPPPPPALAPTLQDLLDRSRETLRLYEQATAAVEQQLREASGTAARVGHDARTAAQRILHDAQIERERLRLEIAALRAEQAALRADLARLVEEGQAERQRIEAENAAARQEAQSLLAEIQAFAAQALAALRDPTTREAALETLAGDQQPADSPATSAPATAETSAVAGPPAVEPVSTPTLSRREAEVSASARAGPGARRLALGLLVVLVLALAALGAPRLLGWGLASVEDEAMAPTLPVGALLLTAPIGPGQARADDVVAVTGGDSTVDGRPWRVAAAETQGGQPVIRIRGDAAPTAEARALPPGALLAQVVYWLPLAGFVLSALALPAVQVVLALVLLALLAVVVLRRRDARAA